MTVQRPLIGDVTVRETQDGIEFLLPPARTLGFKEGGWAPVLGALRWSFVSVTVGVGIVAAIVLLRTQLPDWLTKLVFKIGTFGLLVVLWLALTNVKDAVLVRWAPLWIKLHGEELSFGRRLLGGLLRSTEKVNAAGVTILRVFSVGLEPGAYGEPAYLWASEGEEDVHMLLNGEYPEAWVEAVARLLAEHINASREEDAATLHVVRGFDEDDRDAGAGG